MGDCFCKICLTALYLVLHSNDMDLSECKQQSGDKWEVQLRKGCLELAILATLWGGRLYGLEILKRLEDGSNLIISEGTVYPLLSRLKALGLVNSEWVESEGGHPRKYYVLTKVGIQRVLEMAGIWTRFSSSIRKLLGPLSGENR